MNARSRKIVREQQLQRILKIRLAKELSPMPTNDTPAPREPRCFPTEKDFAALDATEARQTARVAKSDAAWEAVAGLVEGPSGEPLPGSRAVTNEELILSEEIYAAGGDAEARLAERCNAERKSRISIIREYGDPRTWTLPTPAVPALPEGQEAPREEPSENESMIARLAGALADVVVKAIERGTQDGGFVLTYVLPTGPIHRAIPLLSELGIEVRPGFDGRHPTEEPAT